MAFFNYLILYFFHRLKSDESALKATFFISQPILNVVVDTLEKIVTSSQFQYVLIITNIHPNVYDFDDEHFDELKDKCLVWMRNVNYTCEIIVERFPFACFPVDLNVNTSFFLNPLGRVSQENVISLDSYQRLVKQEISEMHTLASNPAINNDHFRQYYQILSSNEKSELKVIKTRMIINPNSKFKC